MRSVLSHASTHRILAIAVMFFSLFSGTTAKKSDPLKYAGLSLARVTGPDVELRWGMEAAPFYGGREAMVTIRDSNGQSTEYLDAKRLLTGSYRYQPVSDDTLVEFRIFRWGRPSALEQLRVVLPRKTGLRRQKSNS
jgi:hypothetical protein